VKVKSLELAISAVATLPDEDQEQIARRLLSHVEKHRRLRDEVDKGLRALADGTGKPLDVEAFLRLKHRQPGGG